MTNETPDRDITVGDVLFRRDKTPRNLTGQDLLAPKLHPVDLDEGRVYLRRPSADRVLHLLGMDPEDRKARYAEETHSLLAEVVCDQEGTPLFESAEQVGKLPIDIWTALNKEATEKFLQDVATRAAESATETPEGEDSGETAGSGSPTDSP